MRACVQHACVCVYVCVCMRACACVCMLDPITKQFFSFCLGVYCNTAMESCSNSMLVTFKMTSQIFMGLPFVELQLSELATGLDGTNTSSASLGIHGGTQGGFFDSYGHLCTEGEVQCPLITLPQAIHVDLAPQSKVLVLALGGQQITYTNKQSQQLLMKVFSSTCLWQV